MALQHVLVERFSFLNCFQHRGECGIEVLPASRDRVVVIATELKDNPGMSITNAAEYVATAVCESFEIAPHQLVWIEHYGYPPVVLSKFPRTYDLVTFASVGPPESTPIFRDPSWRVMQPADWQALGLQRAIMNV